MRFDFDEVLACDGEHVIATRGAWRSNGSRKTGAWEIPVGYVTVVRDGLIARHDLHGYGETEAMLSRFAELSGLRTEASLDPEPGPGRS